jgi:energy-coupling factor transport system ATP-binding protein
LRDIDLELHAGEVVLLSGGNGCGKSSLARVLAGHAVSAGIVVARTANWLRRPGFVALAMPDAGLQLFESTVARELGLAGTRIGEAAERLRRHRLETIVARAPWTLSRGERHRLLHAALDALEPALIVIDEPGQGLDPQDIEDLANLIRERSEGGRTHLLLSHRRELAALAHRHLAIVDGRIVAATDAP